MLKEALQGTHQDFTEGSLNRAIVMLAIPMILEMVMESLFGIVDVFFVSRLGSDAVATVGLTESLLTIVFGIAIGLSISTTAFVARRTGEKDPEGAANVSVQAILLGLIVSAVIGAIGVTTAPQLLEVMGGPPAVQANARYTQLMLGGSAVIFLLFLINGIFRGAGDAALAMRTLWLANAINIVLDPCLINGWRPFPRLGVFGASVATTTGRGIGVLFQLWQLSNGRNRVIVRRTHVRLNIAVMINLLKVSATGIVQFLIATASWIGLVRVVSTFGSAVVAGYTIAIRIIIFTILPAWGLSNAAATLVGQSLGAKKPHRAESSVYLTGFYNMLYLGLISVAFLLLSRPLVGFFTSDPQVLSPGASCLRIIALAYLPYAWGLVVIQGFNGAGDTNTPTLINLLAFWMVQLPAAYLLAIRFAFGPRGAFSAVPIGDVVFAAAAVILFRRGAWKRREI